MANIKDDSLTLRRRLEGLPQEIYDMIYDLTFTAAPDVRQLGTRRKVFSHATPPADPRPALLSIDRRSRAKFAESYYGNGAVFVAYDNFETWLRALPKAHRTIIVDIRCVERRAVPAYDNDYETYNESLKVFAKAIGLDGENIAGQIQFGEEKTITEDLEGYTSLSLEEAKQGREWQSLRPRT